jgi:DNA-binding NarL/FixJ family response regulator
VPYRIVLADDHSMFRVGLKSIIESVPDLEVIGEAEHGLELLRLLRRITPDLIIIDISMPHMGGIETLHEIKANHSDVKVLVLTMHKETEVLIEAVSRGANGYLLKEDSDKQLFSAIKKIRSGGIYVSPKLADQVTQDWTEAHQKRRSPEPAAEQLTIREREILKLTAEGRSSKEIASLLYISHRTVEHHREHIMAKLKLKRTIDLVSYAIAKKYV